MGEDAALQVMAELAFHMRRRRSVFGSVPVCFIARLSELAATAPWRRFIVEVNPVLWTREGAAAVDGLLIVG